MEESSAGSDDLETVFEGNLRRIGRMVAILDTWDRPLYLSRIWTVYEQFVASTLQIQARKGGHCLWKIVIKFSYCNVCRLGCSLTALP